MKCSYCCAEMEKGYLKSSHGMHWGPDRELGSVRDDIHLAKAGWKERSEGVFCGVLLLQKLRNDHRAIEKESNLSEIKSMKVV